jgi:hypothetical protein
VRALLDVLESRLLHIWSRCLLLRLMHLEIRTLRLEVQSPHLELRMLTLHWQANHVQVSEEGP